MMCAAAAKREDGPSTGRVTSLRFGRFLKFRKIPVIAGHLHNIAGDLHNYKVILSNRLEHHCCEGTEADYTHEHICVHVHCHGTHHIIKR